MSIQLLPEEVASQIAAGEVIERPASVVKELLENALDASAASIIIRVEKAGQRLIEIADDGEGIRMEEIPLALARHATSKLSSADDLMRIQSLGFRGEALASIASVSKMTLTSRTREFDFGGRMQVEAGKPGELEKIGAPAGTVVRVEDLFFNLPARLKFLKKDVTERRAINGLVTRYALAYPSVRMQLFHDNRAVLQTSGNGDPREVLASLYGVDVARQMLEVVLEDGGIMLTGFTSPVSSTRSNRREITFFVNGRRVQDVTLITALMQAYHTLLMVGRYPMAVLFLKIPPEEVDVNVHPTKAEVRFRNSDRIFSTVQRGVRRAILAYSPIPQVTTGPFSAWQQEANQNSFNPAWTTGVEPNQTSRMDEVESSLRAPVQPEISPEKVPLLRLVGQVGATYLVAEGPDGLYLIDQHAAHERVLYERFQHQLAGADIPSQALLVPETIQLSPEHSVLLESHLAAMNEFGFLIEPFGQNTYRVRSIPALFGDGDPLLAVRAVVEDIEEDETPLSAELEGRLIARICKRMAVKGGQSLTGDEQQTLLRDLEMCESPRSCPHGRPTMIHLSVDLLERQFGRRGSR